MYVCIMLKIFDCWKKSYLLAKITEYFTWCRVLAATEIFCVTYIGSRLQDCTVNDLGWWHNLGKIFIRQNVKRCNQLEGKLEMIPCCHLISNWFKFCVKIFRNASKNLLTCTLLAFRKILSYIPDQSDLRQQSINISNICSSPVVLHWQPLAVLVLAGLEFDVSTIK